MATNSKTPELNLSIFQRQILLDLIRNYSRERYLWQRPIDLAHNFHSNWQHKENFDKNFVVLSYQREFDRLREMFKNIEENELENSKENPTSK